MADVYDWEWSIDPNPVLRGFVNATGWPLRVDTTTTVDTDSTLPRGCTERCLLSGSLPNIPACGSGATERGEDCDDGNLFADDGCSSNCLVTGTRPPACGNGVLNIGENCEALPDPLAGGALIFPRGCMDPEQDYDGDERAEGWGCVLLGSTAGHSVCGDRILADGEACDDGNTRDGDGCSRDCLNEGTVQLCTAATPEDEPCVSSCGNGLREPGEACDDGNTRDGDGCSHTCLYEGANLVCIPDVRMEHCCGDGRVVPEEGEACDDGNTNNNDGCNNRCLREGSSAFQNIPSFCGDGVVSVAEYPQCDGRVAVPDGLTDTYQVVVSRNNDIPDPARATSTVIADHPEVPVGQEGQARVSLSCTCGAAANGDEHCAAIADAIRLGELPGPAPAGPLGCANSGCCVVKPRVINYEPVAGRDDICRNGAIKVFFDQPMDSVSVKQNLKVGFYNPAGCAVGQEVVRPVAIAMADRSAGGWLANIWHQFVNFVRDHIISPVFGAPAIPLPAAADFCLVNGQVIMSNPTTAEFWPSEPYPANAWLRVRVLSEAKSVDGVRIQSNIAHFGTRNEICRVRRVTINPESDLLSTVEDEHAFSAQVHGGADMPIVSIPGIYAWNLSWLEQPDGGERGDGPVSPIVVEDEIPEGDDFILNPNQARVRIRGSRQGDLPDEYVAQDGKAVVEATAVITESSFDDLAAIYSGFSKVVVMLCNNPWPEWRSCSEAGEVSLPWEHNDGGGPAPLHRCTPSSRVWYPFSDRWTNIEFYYCRDGVRAGDGGDLLPYLNVEDPAGTELADSGRAIVRLINPAPGIMREYLFTFDHSPFRGGSGVWRDDAFGLRIAANKQHIGIADWYADRGFRGSPSSLSVAGYDALRDGRTVYVNAGAQNGADLFTNVYVMSYNDGAAAETIAIFNQILSRIDFNGNLADKYVCREVPPEEEAVFCSIDADCAAGQVCDAPESKLKRDVRRWADLQNMRRAINVTASPPALREGTFLRARTYSIWPSWDTVLGSQLRSNLPKDPLNNIATCPTETGFDTATCWNAAERQFFCGDHSHIYKYSILSGRVQLGADLEYRNAGGVARWQEGNETCLDPVDRASCVARGCEWSAESCNYAGTKIWLGGYRGLDVCTGDRLGEGEECGNGVINETEVDPEICEVGQRRVEACFAMVEIDGADREVEGTREEICQSEGPRACHEFIPVDPSPEGCVVGYCGDGVIQGSLDENCDDGVLNGRYGYCASNCRTLGFRCGDGLLHPSEVCDCGVRNGLYYINAILATGGVRCAMNSGAASAGSCSWDCRGLAPRCGDGIVNGEEECDGGTQTSRGVCLGTSVAPAPPNGHACSNNAECVGDGDSCVFCPTVDQRFTRSCHTNNPAESGDDHVACRWRAWSCTAPGRCGNGIQESSEECDDGNAENNDACTNICHNNVCGDGYVNWAGGELCDDGARNGTPCVPAYGRLCTYCTPACRIGTVSGPYCGDGIIQAPTGIPPGTELCEPVSYVSSVNNMCVSTRPQDQSFGAQTGLAICSDVSCAIACADRESEVCTANVAIERNTDTLAAAGIVGSGGTENEGCIYLPVGSEVRAFCEARRHWTTDESQVTRLPDTCDPDDDNDGVPDIFDCRPLDPRSHPSYVIPETAISIPAASEICGDGIDNNCNGVEDDDWTIIAEVGSPSIEVSGTVRDAVFTSVDIDGARVVVERLICSHDRTTACGADPADPDAECAGRGTCGVADERVSTTVRAGRFTLPPIRQPGVVGSPCRMRIKVEGFKPARDLVISGLRGEPHPLEDRRTRGYFSATAEVPTGVATADLNIFMMPKPPRNNALAAFVWDGSLGRNFLDIHLLVPPRINYHVYYDGSRGDLYRSPWAYLSCYHEDGSEDCNDFDIAPEVVIWNWVEGNEGDGRRLLSYKLYIDDYCNGRNCNRNIISGPGGHNGKVHLAWCLDDAGDSCGLIENISPDPAPPAGEQATGKYWWVLEWPADGPPEDPREMIRNVFRNVAPSYP
jgi:cysteine-rich repeat protein